ncbi:MAG: hypothetical protein JWN45_1769 [Acidobacteriaceae bacterium]|nr:hypothetical protein [Acidobacteriaceae bacterium]
MRVANSRASAGKSRLRKSGSGNSYSADVVRPSCSPEESLKQARMQVRAAMPDIIEAFVKEAKSGSCQHAKFLMEFAVEEPEEERASVAVTDPEEESLASILLRELRESESEPETAG